MLALVTETLPFSEVKAHLSEMADRVENQHDRILVTRNGRPSFILMHPMIWSLLRRPSTS